jgi:hypothetical protein
MISDTSDLRLTGFANRNQKLCCEIWCSHDAEDSCHCLLCCDAVWWYGRIPTFRRTLLPPSSFQRLSYVSHRIFTLKMKEARPPKRR